MALGRRLRSLPMRLPIRVLARGVFKRLNSQREALGRPVEQRAAANPI
jgi:hypothetical protein